MANDMKTEETTSTKRKIDWQKYAFEFLSIFIAVIAAFALSNWNDNRRDDRAASKILLEISNGLEKDLADAEINLGGHDLGIRACKYWRQILQGGEVDTDSLATFYLALTRDFTSIQNTSGYETLKSRGFELIQNDSLRADIISLYEFDYQSLHKMEEEYYELQFQENYFHRVNDLIAPHLIYDQAGNIVGLDEPLRISDADRRVILSYLWKIQFNRQFVTRFYNQVKLEIKDLKAAITRELKG